MAPTSQHRHCRIVLSLPFMLSNSCSVLLRCCSRSASNLLDSGVIHIAQDLRPMVPIPFQNTATNSQLPVESPHFPFNRAVQRGRKTLKELMVTAMLEIVLLLQLGSDSAQNVDNSMPKDDHVPFAER